MTVAIDLRQRRPGRAIFWYACFVPCMIYLFSLIYSNTGLIVNVASLKETTHDPVYFSIVTWTTLGYGDIVPTVDSRPWVEVEVLLGYIYMGLLINIGFVLVSPSRDGG